MPLVTAGLIEAPQHRIMGRYRELPSGELRVRMAEDVQFGGARETPAQAMGRRYENKVGRHLASRTASLSWELWDHQWLEYESEHGFELAQPDFVLIRPDNSAIVVECKLTFTDCWPQIHFYNELLKGLGLDPVGVLVCKNLTAAATSSAYPRVRKLEDITTTSYWQLRL